MKKLLSAVKALLDHDTSVGVFDYAGEIREEWEEGNWVAHPEKSNELQDIIAQLKEAYDNTSI